MKVASDRRLDVLRAIVQDYVATSEPVGSKALLERHQLGVSAATIRNDMAALEEEGLIAAPHTSAGRIPTDAGYRLFVDRLGQVRPLTVHQRRAIRTFLSESVDLDDVVQRASSLLASLTQQAAVMQYPSLRRSRVRHVELVPVTPSRTMLVLILESGRVEQRTVDLVCAHEDVELFLSRLRRRLNEVTDHRVLPEAAGALAALPDEFPDPVTPDVEAIISALTAAIAEEREERVVLAGTGNLARAGTAGLLLQDVLDALEEHVVLLRLVTALAEDEQAPDRLTVRIGAENPHEGLHSTSLVTASYGAGAVATLGVLGPTRMNYPQTMAAVRAVARYVSELIEA